MKAIEMVDLKSQYQKIKPEVDLAIQNVIDQAAFIKGKPVAEFETSLAKYVGANHCISCGNGTDALQIAFMALGLEPDDEVIMPAFTYIATAETAALLKLKVVLVDVLPDSFNIDVSKVKAAITTKTKAIVPVHLFGQCANMQAILELAQTHNLYVIEDSAQAIGAKFTFNDGTQKQAGTMGHIGCTSFFPSKNLGCFGDGGALFTNDSTLAQKIKMLANHGQAEKYKHEIIGVNSRLDTLQAAILNIKLQHLDTYTFARQKAAAFYNQHLDAGKFTLPTIVDTNTHVFHQYTIKINGGNRELIKDELAKKGIPTMVYYPLPLHFQKAFIDLGYGKGSFEISESLCNNVLSLPMHTELEDSQLHYIVEAVNACC
jgi:UDP-2-acetamido-2-deoxy-ribo-hexuluronate aminotransferase